MAKYANIRTARAGSATRHTAEQKAVGIMKEPIMKAEDDEVNDLDGHSTKGIFTGFTYGT